MWRSDCRRRLPGKLLFATDAFGFAEDAVRQALHPIVERLAAVIGNRQDVTLAPQGLSVWQRAQRVLQSSESWKTFEPWLDDYNPRLAFGVARSLVIGVDADGCGAQCGDADADRGARPATGRCCQPGTILCLPTTPFPAPLKGLPSHVLSPLRERISCLTSHGGLTGVPQVNIPGATVEGAPVGLSIIAARGSDLDLMRVAMAMEG